MVTRTRIIMQKIALRNIGLKDSEIKAYLAILSLGTAKVSEIAKKAGLHNKNTYDALKRLNEMGLVSRAAEEGKIIFHAEDPERTLRIWESKRDHLLSVMDELKRIYRQAPSEEEIFVHKGRTGLKFVFEDALKAKECIEIGDIGRFNEAVPHFFHKYQILKKTNRVKCRLLLNPSLKGSSITKDIYGKAKYATEELPFMIVIYSDKVAFIHFGKEIFETIIKSKEMHGRYVEYFNNLWHNLTI
ncbi:MAG: helix-turn-helix domain-containing protein [Candidatus Micrarchaeia archaeon]